MKKKVIGLLLVLLVVGSFIGGFQTARYIDRKHNPEVTVTMIQEALKDCSDLTTAQLEYSGFVRYTDGTINFINKKSFSMIYHATIRAGIDMSKVEIELSPSQVIITLPETQVADAEIDTSHLTFYDESFALFNWTRKEDTTEAVNLAKEDVKNNADTSQLKVHAKEQAKKVIEGLIRPIITDGRELIIQ